MMKAQTYDMVKQALVEQAERLWESMDTKIGQIISKVKSYDRAHEEGDYRQESYFACLKAVYLYSGHLNTNMNTDMYSKDSKDVTELKEYMKTLKGNTKMKLDTFAYWLAEKWIYALAAGDDGVCWSIYDKEGDFKQFMYESDFRKKKTRLLRTGHSFVAHATITQLKTHDDMDMDAGELADSRMRGFEMEEESVRV